MTDRIRTFIAIPTKTNLQNHLLSIQKTIGQMQPGIKWVKPSNMHLTLLFLGDRNEQELERIRDLLIFQLRNVKAFRVPLTQCGAFPDFQNPKVIWAGLKDSNNKIRRLARKLNEGVLQLNIKCDTKPFVPHLTLGRIRTTTKMNGLRNLKKNQLSINATYFEIDEVNLYQSDLMQDGPVYTILEQVCLQKLTTDKN